ncbi:UDP-2,3-diacylglucosamine diphosphatase [Candidatus Latescibacterota bacterium]
MRPESKQLPDRVAFFADTHLGMPGDDPKRIEKVASFIRWLRGRISHLYIIGDLFDFWFEYKSVVPNIAPQVVFELYNLVSDGTLVTLFAGNHDYWYGQYLQKNVGLNIQLNDLTVEHQGCTIYMHHGDGLYPRDIGYRILKKVLRNKLSIFLFRLLHPDCARWFVELSSKTSRNYFAHPHDNIDYYVNLLRDIADNRLKLGNNAVVYGHCHIPLVEQRPKGTLVLLGDWITHNTYVFLENGEFKLYSWTYKENENG